MPLQMPPKPKPANKVQILDQQIHAHQPPLPPHVEGTQEAFILNRQNPTTDIDAILSKYRTLCTTLDSDLKSVAEKIKLQQEDELKREEQEQIKRLQEMKR